MSYNDYIHNKLNNQAFINTDSGIVFEFVAAKVSQLCKTFPIITDNVGFSDVSAIAEYEISSSMLNHLFYFQLSSDLPLYSDIPSNISELPVIKYGINTKFKFNIMFSNSLLTYSMFKTVGQPITVDYITYLAHSISGTTNINIFSNKNQLLSNITMMDSGFNKELNNTILLSGINNSPIFLSTDVSNSFVHSTKQLVNGLLNIANLNRKQTFYNDLINQSINNSDNIYWVPFHKGDKLSLLINYISNQPEIVKPRSYKIILNCGKNFIFPSNVSNVGFNPRGNLDPFYILHLLNYELNQLSQFDFDLNLDSTFVRAYNTYGKNLAIYKEIGPILNPVDLYYKTFLSNVRQSSIIDNGIFNNGINPSFQYIYLNSTITTIGLPSLRKIKQSLIESPYNLYPRLNDINDIQCDLNYDGSSNFIIRIYTRPVYTGIDNNLDLNDTFYGNYYDSGIIQSVGFTSEYNTYHLSDLFNSWTTMINSPFNETVYYFEGFEYLKTLGQQQILSICILTYDINANIGIKNIIVTYK